MTTSSKLNLDYDKVVEYTLLDKRIGKTHFNVPGHDGDLGFGGHNDIVDDVMSYNLFSGGGGGVDRTGPAKVEKVSGSDTQWRVWFKKQNGFNTYVRSFSVEGVI